MQVSELGQMYPEQSSGWMDGQAFNERVCRVMQPYVAAQDKVSRLYPITFLSICNMTMSQHCKFLVPRLNSSQLGTLPYCRLWMRGCINPLNNT